MELKLKPNSELINDNDRFNLLMKFLARGARDQAAHLEPEMREERRTRNAAQADLYLRNRTAYEKAKTDYDALSAEAKAAAIEPIWPEPHVDEEVYDQPVEKFWAMMEKLYQEKSTTRMDEFRYFARRSEETIASPVQRMQALKHALDRPKAPATDSRGMPERTLAQLKELWEAHHNPNACKAVIVPVPSAHVAPVHSQLTKRVVDKDEGLRGPLSNMPLSFIPKDFLREPHRPPPGMKTVPEGMVPVLEAEPYARATPEPVPTEMVSVEIGPGPTNDQAVLPTLETPPSAPNTATDDTLPANFTELPADAPAR
ncbi:hypothetical protein KFL_009180020 [Klebsormidium nitens]|uniref:Uncharacterized protein n=1 Tax=Klebsormidium nitens TaxID=105231 RepID=A0A1Y1IRF4_KLENI|nr:hypothetical protein KFL_009180020 [Klebsormidium nitens]|eukprot:GAQ92079.1 hypothetical protein KFL_009180020 [Klebsormidium nitens]